MRPLPGSITRIAHITDAHVTPHGRRTAVLKDRSVHILDDLIDQLVDVDAVLFGGDNIDNKKFGERDLEAFMDLTARLPRWMCVLGNHESKPDLPGTTKVTRDRFLAAVDGHGIGPKRPCFSEPVGNVRVVGINTTLLGSGGGYVSDATMRYLADELRNAREDHIVVLGHHLLTRPWAPYHLDTWDSDYLVSNRDAINSLLASSPKVRAYLCGHHHAARVDRIAGRGDSGGFYHILSPSPSAYPHGARILQFDDDQLVLSMIRPRIPGLMEEGKRAVLGGRKARRYSTLGAKGDFSDYLHGRVSDNNVVLPYAVDETLRITVPKNIGRRASV